MQSVAQVEQAMQAVFSQADHLAQQSGFVQRSRKLTGKGFLLNGDYYCRVAS